MNTPKWNGPRSAFGTAVVIGLLGALLHGQAAYAADAKAKTAAMPPASNGVPATRRPAEPVKFTLQLTRTDMTGTADTTGTTATIGSPILTTLDGSTATIAVTGEDLSYTIAFSPAIEPRDGKVQILWSIRISGKSLPGGATGIAITGASRVAPGADSGIAEIALSDPATGRKSTFHLQGTTTIGEAAGTLSTK